MIPDTVMEIEQEFNSQEYEILPTLTYRLDFTNHRIIGKIKDQESVMQFVKKVLQTDKYAYEIYDWYYGNEILKLVGRPYEYIVAELPRIIREALLVDDRIISVTDFNFRQVSMEAIEVSFVVNTMYGRFEYATEVQS